MDTEPLLSVQQTLTNNDRCDSCNAQAYVQVFLIEGSLLFCAHHFTKNKDVLTRKSVKIVDESHRLHPNGVKPVIVSPEPESAESIV
jgi:hypothetical protein